MTKNDLKLRPNGKLKSIMPIWILLLTRVYFRFFDNLFSRYSGYKDFNFRIFDWDQKRVQNRIASFPIPNFTVFPMLYEPGRVILDFNHPYPRVAYGPESHIEVQILQKRRSYSCQNPKAFDLQYDSGPEKDRFAPLELGHQRFSRNTYKLFIPRQRCE